LNRSTKYQNIHEFGYNFYKKRKKLFVNKKNDCLNVFLSKKIFDFCFINSCIVSIVCVHCSFVKRTQSLVEDGFFYQVYRFYVGSLAMRTDQFLTFDSYYDDLMISGAANNGLIASGVLNCLLVSLNIELG